MEVCNDGLKESTTLLPSRSQAQNDEQGNARREKARYISIIISVAILIGIVLFAATSSKETSEQSLASMMQYSEEPFSIELSNEYPPIKSLSYYPWDYLAEPYRETTLAVKNYDSTESDYFWTIIDPSGEYLIKDKQGSEIVYVFTEAGKEYTVLAKQQVGETVKRSVEISVMCKYVRREIRDLTQSDLDKYRSAMNIFHRIPEEKGRELYGPKFFNYKELLRLHLQEAVTTTTGKSCSPWHTGANFLTTHLAMTLWVEQNLQLIEPSLAVPHWDYVLDSILYGTDWSLDSPVFSEDYFGAYTPFELQGYWADIPLGTVTHGSDQLTRHNAYDVMTDWYNNNPSKILQRSNEVCGWRFSNLGLPSCVDGAEVLAENSLSTVTNYMEFSLHGRLHIMLGGIWDCSYDFGALKDTYADNKQAQLVLEGILAIGAAAYAQLYNNGYYNDPGTCSDDLSFEDCRYTCSEITSEEMDNLTDDEVYSYLDDWGIFGIYDFNQRYTADVDGTLRNYKGTYKFQNVDTQVDLDLKRHMLRFACSPGKLSPFTSPLAAVNDPVFLSSHAYDQVYWSYLLLRKSKFNYLDWDEATECYGHHIDDQLPWYGFFGEDMAFAEENRYTNRDILIMFHPEYEELPYIHDSFESVERCNN